MAVSDSRRQLFITAMARGSQVQDAAKQASIGEATAYRWLRVAEVQEQIADLRREMVERTVAVLTALGVSAAAVLAELAKGAKSESVRRQAATSILELGMNVRKLEEIEQRLRALEAQQRQAG